MIFKQNRSSATCSRSPHRSSKYARINITHLLKIQEYPRNDMQSYINLSEHCFKVDPCPELFNLFLSYFGGVVLECSGTYCIVILSLWFRHLYCQQAYFHYLTLLAGRCLIQSEWTFPFWRWVASSSFSASLLLLPPRFPTAALTVGSLNTPTARWTVIGLMIIILLDLH